MSQPTVPQAEPLNSRKALVGLRDEYQKGVESLKTQIAQLTSNLAATGGAVQTLDKIIASLPAEAPPPVVPPAPAGLDVSTN
jgi:hypothetical protein